MAEEETDAKWKRMGRTRQRNGKERRRKILVTVRVGYDELTMFSFVITHIGTAGFPSGLFDCIFMLMNSISSGISIDATCPP